MSDYTRWQENSLKEALQTMRVIMLTGPRQCGKSTLAKKLVSASALYKTLDDNATLQSARSDPQLFVANAPGGGTLIIDEIQKAPDLLPAIKKIVDQNNRPGQFLITGSANILTLPTVQESLAGRVGKVLLRPLSQGEILGTNPDFIANGFNESFTRCKTPFSRNSLLEVIFKGGFPEALRLNHKARKKWHNDYIDALIEHDMRDVLNVRQINAMKDLSRILAAWSTKFMEVASIGAHLALDRRTLVNYIAALQAFYIVETIPPWLNTDYDRIGKLAKLVMGDTGVMASLLGWKLDDFNNDSDKPGKFFETFSYNELAAQIDASEDTYYLHQYRDHEKREIDFLIERENRDILAIEIKSGLTIRKSDFKSITWFKDHLAKDRKVIGIILYAGEEILPFGKNLWAVPFDCIWGAGGQ